MTTTHDDDELEPTADDEAAEQEGGEPQDKLEPTTTDDEAAEPQEPAAEDAGEEVAGEDDDEPPPPPARPTPTPGTPTSPSAVKPLPGFVPLPVVPLDDPRVKKDAETLAEAAICAAVFRVLADRAQAHYNAILTSDEEMPSFLMDDSDRDLLAAMFVKDQALTARIRLAAGTVARKAEA